MKMLGYSSRFLSAHQGYGEKKVSRLVVLSVYMYTKESLEKARPWLLFKLWCNSSHGNLDGIMLSTLLVKRRVVVEAIDDDLLGLEVRVVLQFESNSRYILRSVNPLHILSRFLVVS